MTSIYVTAREPYLQPALYKNDCRQNQMAAPHNKLIRKDLINPPLFADYKVDGAAKEILTGVGLILANYDHCYEEKQTIQQKKARNKPTDTFLGILKGKKTTTRDAKWLLSILKQQHVSLKKKHAALTKFILEKSRPDDKKRNPQELERELMQIVATLLHNFPENLLQKKGVAHTISFLHELSKSLPQFANARIQILLTGMSNRHPNKCLFWLENTFGNDVQEFIQFIDSLLNIYIYENITPNNALLLISALSFFPFFDEKQQLARTIPLVEKLYSHDNEVDYISYIDLMRMFFIFLKNLLQEKGAAHTIRFLHDLSNSRLQMAAIGIKVLLITPLEERLKENAFGRNTPEFIQLIDSVLRINKEIPLQKFSNLIFIASRAYEYSYDPEKLATGSLSKEQSILLARLILENLCCYDINNFHVSHLQKIDDESYEWEPLHWQTIEGALQELRKDYEKFQLFHTLRLLEKEDSSPYWLPGELIKKIIEGEAPSS